MAYDIEPDRALAVVAAAKHRSEELDTVRVAFQGILDQLNAALDSGPVAQAAQSYSDAVLMPDLQALGQRMANIFGGAQSAVSAYVAGDEQMVSTAVRNAHSVADFKDAGFRAHKFQPQPVG